MFKAILRSAATNARRLLYVWLAVLLVNQLVIFGACFAPYCLLAAVPHTLAIAVLLNFLGFKEEEGMQTKSAAKARPASGEAQAPSGSPDSAPAARRTNFAGYAIVTLLIALCVVLVAVSMNRRDSAEADTDSSVVEIGAMSEAVVDLSDERERVEDLASDDEHQEVPDERAPSTGDLDGQVTGTAAYREPPYEEADDDEFDINDIERYERLHKRRYQGTADRARQQLYVESDSPAGDNALNLQALAPEEGSGSGSPSGSQRSYTAYRCVNSSGKVSDGTGRRSKDSEYSTFLKRNVHAGEFVVFRYSDATREYWFKSAHCARL